MVAERVSPEALLDAAHMLATEIEAASAQIERDRRLPPALVGRLIDAGLFRILVPRSLGGSEAPLPIFARVMETIARADASTAWCLCQAAGESMVSAFLSEEIAEEIFGSPRAILAWGPGPGTAVAVEGGYRLTGRWSFASGCHHATWFGGMCNVVDTSGRELCGSDGAPLRPRLLFPATEAEVTDTWQVSGLRGTGSDTYAVKDLFVPSDRTMALWPQPAREPGPLYLFAAGGLGFTSAFAVGFSSVALGIAGALLDAFLDLAITKTPRGMSGPLREQGAVQAQVGEAIATLGSARAYLHQTIGEIWEDTIRTGKLSVEHRDRMRLAATHAIQRATQVTDVIFHATGATAIFNSEPFERRFRDAHAVSQQVQGRREHYETAGRYFMGLESDLQWI